MATSGDDQSSLCRNTSGEDNSATIAGLLLGLYFVLYVKKKEKDEI